MRPIVRTAPACTHLSVNDPQQKEADGLGGILEGEEIRNGLRGREQDEREKSDTFLKSDLKKGEHIVNSRNHPLLKNVECLSC